MGTQTAGLHLSGTVELGRFTLDINLRAQPGETLALLGPNGCGKSTTLAAVAGLRGLTTGRLTIGAAVLDDPVNRIWVPAHDRRIGYVFQDLQLFPHLNARDNIAYGLRRHGRNRAAAREVAEDWLHLLGIPELGAARPATLSGGQAQRVALARALAIEPDVLLLDEPMSALDAHGRLAIRGQLRRRLDAYSGIALLVTHDLIDVVGLADRVVVLEGGRIIQEATPHQLLHHPRSPHAAAMVGRNVLPATRTGTTLHLAPGIDVSGQPGEPGPVDVVCSPIAVRLSPAHLRRPAGAWQSTVIGIEAVGDHARAHLGPPLPLLARVPLDELSDDLALDQSVWVSLDPALLEVYPQSTR
jgi:molybdate transport system ATP-binding protein